MEVRATSSIKRSRSRLCVKSKSPVSYRPISCAPSQDIPSSIKYFHFISKSRNYIVRPSTKVISSRPSTSANLGPGKYNIQDSPKGPFVEFSRVPRFNSYMDLVSHRYYKKESKNSDIIEINKDQSKSKMSAKIEKIRENSAIEKTRLETNRITRKNIFESRKLILSNKIKEKYKKMEFKEKFSEIQNIKSAWILLFCLAGTAHVTKIFLINRKKLRIRAHRMIKTFMIVIRAIGKIKIKLKKYQVKKAFRTIKNFLVPYMKLWTRKKNLDNRKLVVNCFEKFLCTSLLFNVIAVFNSKIIHIQRTIRFLVFIKKKLYAKLIFLWNQAEKKVFNKKKKRKKQSKSKKKAEVTSSIPDDIKFVYLNQHIKNISVKYLNSIKNYKQQCSEIMFQNEHHKHEIAVLKYKKIEMPKRPRSPNIIQMTCDESLLTLIQKAIVERSKWAIYLNYLNLKIQKSYI